MPMPGDVDIVLASELMEAARAVQRGLVTPDRTTLIASTHRVWSITEKTRARRRPRRRRARSLGACRAPRRRAWSRSTWPQAAERGRQRHQRGPVRRARRQRRAAVRRAAVRGRRSRAAASASPPAGAPSTPASRARRRAGRRCRGRRGERLRRLGDGGADGGDRFAASGGASGAAASTARDPAVAALVARARTGFPIEAQAIVLEGVRRTIDWQDPAYAALYLDRLAKLHAAAPAPSRRLLAETRAPPRALDDLRRHDPRRRAEDARDAASRASTARCAPTPARCSRSTSTCIRACRRSARPCPRRIGRWLERPGWLRRAGRAPDRAGRVVTTSSLARLPAALRDRRAAPLSPRQPALRGRGRAHRGLAGRDRPCRRAQPGAGDRDRAVPAPGQGLRRHPRARLCATSTTLMAVVAPRRRGARAGDARRAARRRARRRARPGAERGAGAPRARLTDAERART